MLLALFLFCFDSYASWYALNVVYIDFCSDMQIVILVVIFKLHRPRPM